MHTIQWTKTAGVFVLIVGVPWFLTTMSGCITTNDKPRADMRQKEDLLILHEDLVRVQGRIEGLELEYRRLLGETEKLHGSLSQIEGQTSGTQRRLDELERRLADLNAAREKDRDVIIDQLVDKIEDILGKSGGTSRSTAASTTGYEHIVRAGETLSEIATAYKVKAGVIIEANSLKNPDMLKEGQKLFIPQ